MSKPVITVQNLTKRFKKLTAVDEVSFDVNSAEIFGFLGPNGAGKTTTVSMLVTLLRPTSGRVLIGNHDLVKEQAAVRKQIGVVFQQSTLDDRLTAAENLDFHAVLYHVPANERKRRIQDALELVQLADRGKDLVRQFSGGMKRRLEIARALLHSPRILFLDEPTIGLDPPNRRQLWDHLLNLRTQEGVTIFLTTHYMEEAEYADRIAIMNQGKIIALDGLNQLKKQVGGDIITVRTPNVAADAQRVAIQFGLNAQIYKDELRLEVPDGEAFIPRFVREFRSPIQAISLRRPTLDDVFLKLTGRTILDANAGDPVAEPSQHHKVPQEPAFKETALQEA